ncbi:MAG TPA: prephenate dehydratase [Gammaproteobacteria bacterium]|nr:prephenate dehydratase [Gammaproteobacteria bacterium]
MTDKLDKIRQQIDALDEKLQALISERARLAQQVAEVKQARGDDAVFYRPAREAAVLREVLARNEGPLPGEAMARLFREIMSACLALEQPLKVAFLGPEGTFTQAAALKHFGHAVDTVPLSAIDEVFREVRAGAVNYGVVPVENSTEGVVNHTLDMFMQSSLTICGEVDLRVHHHLLSRQQDRKKLQRIYSHQQSLAQCREWLDAHLPDVERVSVSSNAEAARRAAEEDNTAAIASDVAAELYGLEVLKANIEDNPDNITRFLIIGHQAVPPSGDDKTSLLISARNKPGALYQLLKPFAENDISMNRIESRPSRLTNWEYVFFIDINGHVEDEKVAQCLDTLREEAAMLKVLGSYPRAVL